MVEGGGTEWHQTNRGVSIYIAIYLSLFLLVAYFSVSGTISLKQAFDAAVLTSYVSHIISCDHRNSSTTARRLAPSSPRRP